MTKREWLRFQCRYFYKQFIDDGQNENWDKSFGFDR